MRRQLRTSLLLALLAFIIKLIYALIFYDVVNIKNDAVDYLEYSQLIIKYGLFHVNPNDVEAFAPPGFPLVLAASILLTGSMKGIVLFNSIFSTITVFIIHRLALRFMSNAWAKYTALYAILFYPYTMYLDELIKESWIQMLVPFTFILLLRILDKAILIRMIQFSVIFVILIHSDERYAFIYFAVVLVLLLLKKLAVKNVFLMSALIVLFSSPWLIRNYKFYNRTVILTERFQAPIDKLVGYNENRFIERSKNFKDKLVPYRDSLMNGLNPRITFGRQRDVFAAVENGLYPHDFSLGERIYYNTMGYWSPIRMKGILLGTGWKFKGKRSTAVNILYSLNYGWLIPFMCIGFAYAFKERLMHLVTLFLFLFVHYSLHILLIFGSGRYRHPLDFIVIIVAFYGLKRILNNLKC